MSKTIPCFICGVAVELHNETAIAALCEKHRTEVNIEKLKNTPTHQLLRILNDGIKQELEASKTETTSQIKLLRNKIDLLEAQLLSKEVKEIQKKPETTQGNVNQWGEII